MRENKGDSDSTKWENEADSDLVLFSFSPHFANKHGYIFLMVSCELKLKIRKFTQIPLTFFQHILTIKTKKEHEAAYSSYQYQVASYNLLILLASYLLGGGDIFKENIVFFKENIVFFKALTMSKYKSDATMASETRKVII